MSGGDARGWSGAVAAVVAVIAGASSACLGIPGPGAGDGGGGDADTTSSFEPVIALSGARYQFCAIGSGGRVACWGDREFAEKQVPDDGTRGFPSPALLLGEDGQPLTGATAISVGDTSACVATATNVLCWGVNNTAQLGRGELSPDGTPLPAGPVLELGGAATVAVGASHACALVDDALWCWGRNASGELGVDTSGETREAPVRAATYVAGVTAGRHHTCAIRATSGEVLCTGLGESGQVGSIGDRTALAPVPGLGDMSTLAGSLVVAGHGHTCAAIDDCRLACWGSNTVGELGRGTTSAVETTQLVDLPTDCALIAVEVGVFTSCAVCGSRALCWGGGGGGRLGIGISPASQPAPVPVVDLVGPTAVALGIIGGCALVAGGVRCWGGNTYGALGVGKLMNELSEVTGPGEPVDFGALD